MFIYDQSYVSITQYRYQRSSSVRQIKFEKLDSSHNVKSTMLLPTNVLFRRHSEIALLFRIVASILSSETTLDSTYEQLQYNHY